MPDRFQFMQAYYFRWFEWRLLANQLAFVPGFPVESGFHGRLLC
ncbi:MAG: hypothetical protein ACYDB1_02335 [Acidiferrobacteraceae bacterium]